MGLTRSAQCGIAVETTEGTEETLVAADYSGNRKESSHRYSAAEYERGLDRGTLTRQRPIRGAMQRLAINWTEEFVGGDASNQAPVHETLQGLGFEILALKKITTTGAPSGSGFEVGDVFGNNATEGSATAKGIVAGVRAVTGGATYRVWYYPTLGSFEGSDALTNYSRTSSATMTADDPADGGFRFKPLSERDASVPPSVTVQRRLSGQLHSAVAARGTGGLSLRQEEPILVRAEFEGVPIFDPSGNTGFTPRAGSYLADVPDIADPPKLTTGIVFKLRGAGGTWSSAIMTELDITFGNTLAARPTITNAAFHSSGYRGTRISDRDFMARLDPEHVLPATFDFIGDLIAGNAFAMTAEAGSPFDSNGLVVIHGPVVQQKGDSEPGDRDGLVTNPMEIGFYGADDDELVINHCFDA